MVRRADEPPFEYRRSVWLPSLTWRWLEERATEARLSVSAIIDDLVLRRDREMFAEIAAKRKARVRVKATALRVVATTVGRQP